MPFSYQASDPATSQTGIKKPGTSLPSVSGTSSSSYPTQTPPATSSRPMSADTSGNVRGPGSRYDPVKDPSMAWYWNASQEQRQLYDMLGQNMAYVGADGKIHMKEQKTPWFVDVVAALVLAGGASELLGALGTAGAAASGGGAGAAAGATEAAATTAAAGEAAAATSAAAATLPAAAGSLGEIVVTAPGAALGAGSFGAGLASIGAGVGAMLPTSADVAGSVGQAAGQMPTANMPGGGLDWSKLGQAALKRGATNAALSAVMGGDPAKGFISGAIGGGIGSALGQYEAATGALQDLGKVGTAGVNAAISSGATAAIMGGDPLKAALSGGVSGMAGTALSGILGTGGGSFDPGAILGSTAASNLMNQIMGGGKKTGAAARAGGLFGDFTTGLGTTGQGGLGASGGSVKTTGYTPSGTLPQFYGPETVNYPMSPFSGVGYRGGGGTEGPSGEDYSYFEDKEKLKRLLAALQQGGIANAS